MRPLPSAILFVTLLRLPCVDAFTAMPRVASEAKTLCTMRHEKIWRGAQPASIWRCTQPHMVDFFSVTQWAASTNQWLLTAEPGSSSWLQITPLNVALSLANLLVYAVLTFKFMPYLKDGESPFVPTASEKLQAMFGDGGCLLPGGGVIGDPPVSQQHLVDLGSGDGSVVRAAARIGGFGKASGYELNPALVRFSKLRSAGRSNEVFHLTSLWEAPLSDVDVVVLYILPNILAELAEKLSEELRDGAVVCSNRYPLPESQKLKLVREVTNVQTPLLNADVSSSLYCYRVCQARGE